jgi:hypothetical protein
MRGVGKGGVGSQQCWLDPISSQTAKTQNHRIREPKFGKLAALNAVNTGKRQLRSRVNQRSKRMLYFSTVPDYQFAL